MILVYFFIITNKLKSNQTKDLVFKRSYTILNENEIKIEEHFDFYWFREVMKLMERWNFTSFLFVKILKIERNSSLNIDIYLTIVNKMNVFLSLFSIKMVCHL